MATKFDARQTISRALLSRLTSSANTELDNILQSLNTETTPPFALSESNPVDRVVNVGAISLINPETGRKNVITPINNTIPTFASGTITVGATGADSATPSAGSALGLAMSASQFLKINVAVNSSGNMVLTKGTAGASEAAATQPSLPPNSYSLGYFVVETNGSNNVQNITASDIYQYVDYGFNSATASASTLRTFTTYSSAQLLDSAIDDVVFASGNTTLTLPAAAANSGVEFTIKKTDSNATTVTLDGNASETIDGSITYTIIEQYESVVIACNGTSWFVI
jgi:hypothetical protein